MAIRITNLTTGCIIQTSDGTPLLFPDRPAAEAWIRGAAIGTDLPVEAFDILEDLPTRQSA